MTAPAARLLDRLEAVREVGRGRWIARCPAHEDLLANGFEAAFLVVGGRVLIDESKFFEIVSAQNGRGGEAS